MPPANLDVISPVSSSIADVDVAAAATADHPDDPPPSDTDGVVDPAASAGGGPIRRPDDGRRGGGGGGAGERRGDVYSRWGYGSREGRGALGGWTRCPLCPSGSNKRYASGRGLSAHLHAVHTPWRLGKSELRRIERSERRRVCESRREAVRVMRQQSRRRRDMGEGVAKMASTEEDEDDVKEEVVAMTTQPRHWEPTADEVEDWNRRVAELTAIAEEDLSRWKTVTGGFGGGGGAGADDGRRRRRKRRGTEEERVADAFALDGSSEDGNDGHGVGYGDDHGRSSAKKARLLGNKRQRASSDDSPAPAPTVAIPKTIGPGLDRTGRRAATSYRDSLPTLHRLAADGDLDGLRGLLMVEGEREDPRALLRLLDSRDRNGSVAEHWAAGGGHVDCLSYLLDLRGKCERECSLTATTTKNTTATTKTCTETGTGGLRGGGGERRIRRRDGKTSLHWAARNGRVGCLDLILGRRRRDERRDLRCDGSSIVVNVDVDEPSGDGTTPLHLACYGGHLAAVRRLVERWGADPLVTNDWGCGTAHWAAMGIGCDDVSGVGDDDDDRGGGGDRGGNGGGGGGDVVDVCEYLRHGCGVPFHLPQKNGHTPLHKAAQRFNRSVVEWMYREAPGGGGGVVVRGGGARGGSPPGAGLTEEERRAAGRPDDGGNRPSDILAAAVKAGAVGGGGGGGGSGCGGGGSDDDDLSFVAWVRDECRW